MTYPSFQNIHNTPEVKIFIKPTLIVTERTIKNPSFFSSEENNQTLFFIDSNIKTRKPFNINKDLDGINTINKIISFSEKFFIGELQELYIRLKKVIDLYDNEEDEPISIESLKSLLKFILNIPFKLKKPTLTLNENGTFQLNWKQDSSNIITLRFKPESNLDYVIFKPSKRSLRPIILHGNMNMLDFIEYLKDLNLYKILREAPNA